MFNIISIFQELIKSKGGGKNRSVDRGVNIFQKLRKSGTIIWYLRIKFSREKHFVKQGIKSKNIYEDV